MKRWVHKSIEPVEGGVRVDNGLYYIDYRYNAPEDIIDIVKPQLYMSIQSNVAYTFGYKFNDNASSRERTEFIHSVKQIGDNPLTDNQLDQFIKRPMAWLNEIINTYKIDCMVYPNSNRSPLVSKIIRGINDVTSHNTHRCSFEMVKEAPTNIQFDFEAFESDFKHCQGYKQMVQYVNNELIPKLHDLDYFSIAENVKSKYRPYIKGFLNFKDPKDIEKFSRLQGDNILVVDDINTTGSTLNEILRKLGELNNNSNFYVYTLIGK